MAADSACRAWYDDISADRLQSTCDRAGWSISLYGSQKEKAEVVLPQSGKRIFPSFGNTVSPQELPAQSGFGVSVVGKRTEVMACKLSQPPPLETVAQSFADLIVEHKESDGDLVFLSEKAKQERAKCMVRPHADSAEPQDIAATVGNELPCVEPEQFIFDALRDYVSWLTHMPDGSPSRWPLRRKHHCLQVGYVGWEQGRLASLLPTARKFKKQKKESNKTVPCANFEVKFPS
jgi:hypothetical protein